MDNYLVSIMVAVAIVVLGIGVTYCQLLDEKHKEKAIRRAKKLLSHDKAKRLENKLESLLPLEIRQLNSLPDSEFGKRVDLLLK